MSLAPINKSLFLDQVSAWPMCPQVTSPGQFVRALIVIFALMALCAAMLLQGTAHAAPASEQERFQSFVHSLWPQARARGVSQPTFAAAFKNVVPDPNVLALTKRQPEFRKTIAQYLASAVSQKRIDAGQAKAREWKTVLEHVDARYGVDPYVVLGVWGLETNFGTYMGDLSTIRSLATLAFAHYRGDYFRRELLDALDILEARHVAPADMQGSWAGAMGHTQFMPSSFKIYAVDYDGDGHKDIWKSIPDALASTANYLKRHGWIANETWGYEVTLPAGFVSASHAANPQRPFAHWAALGLTRTDGEPLPRSGTAAFLQPAAAGPAFLVTPNFKVIKSYNNSTSYALGVVLLGDRIAGEGPLKAAWPVAER
jgi:membrane-bound lytic murein transglycosylase B